MPTVKFTRNLQRFFPQLDTVEIEGGTIAEILANLDAAYPGLAAYILDDQGRLRQHVNIFIGEELIHDQNSLSDPVEPDDRVFILQALSGGQV
jgi:molybdopterin converting factor small subunit